MNTVFRKIITYFLNKRFVRFAISGGVATGVDIALLYALTEWGGLWYLISSIFSFMAGSITHFAISRRWVFDQTEKTFWRQYQSFFAIHLGGLAINLAVLYLLVEYAHLYYLVAKVINVLCGVSWTYWANQRITFKKQ